MRELETSSFSESDSAGTASLGVTVRVSQARWARESGSRSDSPAESRLQGSLALALSSEPLSQLESPASDRRFSISPGPFTVTVLWL